VSPLERENSNLVIGYMGTGTHYIDLKPVIPVIKDILKKYPTTIFQMQGCIDYPFLTEDEDFKEGGILHDRIKLIPFTDNMVDYFSYIQAVDIGICPLADIKFNYSKSNLKYLQFAAMGKPVLCSNVEPYLKTYNEGGPMRLIKDLAEWPVALSRFIEDVNLRVLLGEISKKFVLNNYDQKTVAGQWVDFYEKIQKGELK
jgi:glycosyltransferase involved in cell wall biosynthesis